MIDLITAITAVISLAAAAITIYIRRMESGEW
jgi:hypothetical protein